MELCSRVKRMNYRCGNFLVIMNYKVSLALNVRSFKKFKLNYIIFVEGRVKVITSKIDFLKFIITCIFTRSTHKK